MYTNFKEISINEFPNVDKSKYPDYFYEDSLPANRLFKYNDLYVEIVIDENDIPYVSFINLGYPVRNILKICFPFLTELIDEYGIMGFQWTLKGTTSFLKKYIKILDDEKYRINILDFSENNNEIIIRRIS